VVAVGPLYTGLWLSLRDRSLSWSAQIGEWLGSQAVLAMTLAALLAVSSAMSDDWFGGPVARRRWHRGSALSGVALVLVHASVTTADAASRQLGGGLAVASLFALMTLTALASMTPGGRLGRLRGPVGWLARLPYDPWKAIHRLLALALLAGVTHGLLDSATFAGSPTLTAVHLGLSILAAAALLYQLGLRRYVLRGAPHDVTGLERIAGDVLVITMRPLGVPLRIHAGRFVEVLFSRDRHGAHPFTVIGSRPDGEFQIAVRANGNDTSALHQHLRIADRAWVRGPRGDLDHRRGGPRQIWIAGGIGITPFLGWVHSLGPEHDTVVDLWYSVTTLDQAAFLDELVEAAAQLPWLTLHVVESRAQGVLTADRVLAESASGTTASVFLCGPPAMVTALRRGLAASGPAGGVFHESFSPR
jgi:predicted ferric reductase